MIIYYFENYEKNNLTFYIFIQKLFLYNFQYK